MRSKEIPCSEIDFLLVMVSLTYRRGALLRSAEGAGLSPEDARELAHLEDLIARLEAIAPEAGEGAPPAPPGEAAGENAPSLPLATIELNSRMLGRLLLTLDFRDLATSQEEAARIFVAMRDGAIEVMRLTVAARFEAVSPGPKN